MIRKLSFILVGFFCTGLYTAQAAFPPPKITGITVQNPASTQQVGATQQTAGGTMNATKILNDDSFNFIIANPNTVDPKKFMFEIKPGESTSDYTYVKNTSDVPLKFNLYGSDSTKTAQGSFALETKDEQPNEVGKWITFDEKEFTLQPGEYKKVKFHVNVPQGTPLGIYSGGVSAEKSKPDTGNPNIIIAVRISLRVDVKVTDNPQPVTKKFADLDQNPFYQVYFWASLGLFVVSAGALGWSYYVDRKTPVRKPRKRKK